MKTTFRFIIAAMAAISVFSSCQKELANETVNNATDGVRTISVQFDNSTKASLSGLAPTFTNNDKIRVSNDTKSEVCTVSVDGSGNTTFTTTLSGTLTAIYPADAAVLGSGEGQPIVSPYFKVLATQTGKVEDAIIAKATIASNSATFTGVTALFEIAPPPGATSVTITSLKQIGTDGQRSGTAVAINTEGVDDAAKCKITVNVPTGGTAYVSLVPGVNLTDLSFDAGETYGMKGIPASKITGGLVDETAANKKYTIGNSDNTWHPYVTIGGKKWATENIGATDTDPYGTYFSWGALEKVYTTLSGTSFTFGTNPDATRYTGAWAAGSCFANCNTPYYNGSEYTKYTGTSGDKTTLDLADDAAYVNWGGPWRMPTGGTESNADFTALAKAANESYSSSSLSITQTITTSGKPSSQGVYYYNVSGETVGVYFVDSSLKKLFFPAAGRGDDGNLDESGSLGYYWSSTLDSSNPRCAYTLGFGSGGVNPRSSGYRCNGRSVRPLSD